MNKQENNIKQLQTLRKQTRTNNKHKIIKQQTNNKETRKNKNKQYQTKKTM